MWQNHRSDKAAGFLLIAWAKTGSGPASNQVDLSRKSAGYLSPLRSYPFKRERAFTA